MPDFIGAMACQHHPLSTAVQDYLKRIHELTEAKGYARVADIADALGIARPSVSAMVQRMAQAGLVNYERYRGLTLTPTGEAAALGIRHRHKVLSEFLAAIGVPSAQAEQDVDGLEHHLSGAAVEKIESLLPRLGKDFLHGSLLHSRSKKLRPAGRN
jgi:Mn-dependent DtxR family transcriptional regulator